MMQRTVLLMLFSLLLFTCASSAQSENITGSDDLNEMIDRLFDRTTLREIDLRIVEYRLILLFISDSILIPEVQIVITKNLDERYETAIYTPRDKKPILQSIFHNAKMQGWPKAKELAPKNAIEPREVCVNIEDINQFMTILSNLSVPTPQDLNGDRLDKFIVHGNRAKMSLLTHYGELEFSTYGWSDEDKDAHPLIHWMWKVKKTVANALANQECPP